MFSHIWYAKQGFSKHCDSESKDEFQQWKKQRLKKKNNGRNPLTIKPIKMSPQPIQRLSNLIPCRSSILSQPFPVTFPNSSPVASTVVKSIPSVWISVGLFVSNNLPVIMVVSLETLKFEAF